MTTWEYKTIRTDKSFWGGKDKTDIEIKGSSLYSDYLSALERDDMLTWDSTVLSSKEAFEQSGLTPGDIDFDKWETNNIFEIITIEDNVVVVIRSRARTIGMPDEQWIRKEVEVSTRNFKF